MNASESSDERAWRLLDAACNDTLSDEQVVELQALLDGDSRWREQYVLLCNLQADLAFAYRIEKAHRAVVEKIERLESSKLAVEAPRAESRWTPRALVAATRAPLLGFLNRLPSAIQPARYPMRFFAVAISLTMCFWGAVALVVASRGQHSNLSPQAELKLPFDAKIIRLQDVEWGRKAAQVGPGANLPRTQVWELLRGRAQLLFGGGAVVVLEGPARFQIDSANQITLEQGKLLARADGRARGFTVQTPRAAVVDQGTEFGVEVSEQVSVVQVFEGSVRLIPSGSSLESKRDVTTGQAVVWENSPQSGFLVKEKKMNRLAFLSMAAILYLPLGSSAQGALIWVDFGQTSEITASTAWNNIHGTGNPGPIAAGPHNLNYNTGASSGITLGITSTGTVGHAGGLAYYEGPYPPAVSDFPQTALRDGIYYTSGGTITATLSNLNPEATYDFLFYGSAANIAGSTSWNVTGQNNGLGVISNPLNNSTTVALVSGIIPNGSNQISIFMSGADPGRWNVWQITENLPPPPIPEPTSAILLGVGGMLTICLSRRRKRGSNKPRCHRLPATP